MQSQMLSPKTRTFCYEATTELKSTFLIQYSKKKKKTINENKARAVLACTLDKFGPTTSLPIQRNWNKSEGMKYHPQTSALTRNQGTVTSW